MGFKITLNLPVSFVYNFTKTPIKNNLMCANKNKTKIIKIYSDSPFVNKMNIETLKSIIFINKSNVLH